jgi:hypothetical protein
MRALITILLLLTGYVGTWLGGFCFAQRCYDIPYPTPNDPVIPVVILGCSDHFRSVSIMRLDTGQQYTLPNHFKMTQNYLDHQVSQ